MQKYLYYSLHLYNVTIIGICKKKKKKIEKHFLHYTPYLYYQLHTDLMLSAYRLFKL